MKKIVRLLLVIIAAVNCTSCAKATQDQEELNETNIKVAALKGPTAIGMVHLMEETQKGKTSGRYEFQIAGTADSITAGLLNGNIQIACIPCNLAAMLYNKSGGKISVAGINTLGVLYILETGAAIHSVEDLKGKTIYTTGKGTTPEYTLNYLLKAAGLSAKDVTVEYKSEAAEAAIFLASHDNAVAMLPQPYAAIAAAENDKVRIALDVTKEWEKYAGADSTVITGVIVVNVDFTKNHPDILKHFIEEYKQSVEFVNTHVEEAAELTEKFEILKASVAKTAIPYCNITFIDGEDMKTKITSYLRVLYEENPLSIGGQIPDENFYDY